MGCDGNNATPPGPAIAPGAEEIDPRRAAGAVAARGMDPRLTALVPAFDAPFFQAGLCGYSDAAMRIVARRHGCPFCVTEALLDRTILAGGRGFAKADLGALEDNVPGGDEDHPLAGQVMGSDPREMAAAALKMVEQAARAEKDYRRMAYVRAGVHPSTGAGHGHIAHGHSATAVSLRTHLRLPGGEQIGWYDPGTDLDAASTTSSLRPSVPSSLPECTFATIDVNLACPVKKIDRKARGGHWLAEPEGAIAILEAVRGAVPRGVHCTVKVRRAYDDTPEMAGNLDRILHAATRIGYGWATVHARTVEQKYVGPSRWDLLRDIVRRHPELPILGSGDVWEVGDIFRMIAYTGVAAAAVARGCIGNPWIFRQARALMAGAAPAPPTIDEQRRVLDEHFRLALAVNARGRSAVNALCRAEAHTGKTMRKFGIRFAGHHPRAGEVRRRMIAVSSLDDWRAVLDEFYSPAPATSPPVLPVVPVLPALP